jgi:hypothetical protein
MLLDFGATHSGSSCGPRPWHGFSFRAGEGDYFSSGADVSASSEPKVDAESAPVGQFMVSSQLLLQRSSSHSSLKCWV